MFSAFTLILAIGSVCSTVFPRFSHHADSICIRAHHLTCKKSFRNCSALYFGASSRFSRVFAGLKCMVWDGEGNVCEGMHRWSHTIEIPPGMFLPRQKGSSFFRKQNLGQMTNKPIP